MNILYDTTYCFKGKSGIPRDARSLARIIAGPKINGDLVVFPKNLISVDYSKINGQNIAVSNAIRQDQGRDPFPHIIRLGATFLRAILRKKRISLYKLNTNLNRIIEGALEATEELSGDVLLGDMSSIERWVRPRFRSPFKLNTKKYKLFIQQQIDPLQISRSTRHVVRLHDIIPITHPECFDHQAVVLYTSGLGMLLKKKNIFWVMDTHASFVEFKKYFGEEIQGDVIPCVIDPIFTNAPISAARSKQILVLGTLEPRKRVDLVCKAFVELKRKNLMADDWQLIVAGGAGWQSETLLHYLDEGVGDSSIKYLNAPTDAEVLELMSESSILVSASTIEGFGLPPLEALAMGMSVVVSDIEQHRETMNEEALYFRSYEDLCEKLLLTIKAEPECDIEKRLSRRNYILSRFSTNVISEQWVSLLSSLTV